jgi:GGDEF domain-containing protein
MAQDNKDSIGMMLDAVAGSEAIDSSGEILDVRGANIDDYTSGLASLVIEHRDWKDPKNVVGKVVFAKKIYKLSDCDDDRQKEYWNQLKLPYIYVKCRLLDAAGHQEAQAIAANVRDAIAHGEKPIFRMSVEGSTLKRTGNRLDSSVLRRLAITQIPCNRSAHSGLLSDPNAPDGFDKEPAKKDEEIERSYIKELIEARKSEDASYFYKSNQFEFTPFESIEKGLEAGNYNVAPSALTGGSALSVEDPALRRRKLEDLGKRAAAVFRDWNKTEPIRPILKNKLPEADESLLNHFENMADDYRFGSELKGYMKKMEEIVWDLQKTAEPNVSNFGGKRFKVGQALVGSDAAPHTLLGHDQESYYGVPSERYGNHSDHDLVKLPFADQNRTYTVPNAPGELVESNPNHGMLGLNHVYTIYGIHPEDKGVSNTILGKYLLHNDAIHVLEDHNGILSHVQDGPITPLTQRFLESLKNSSYVKVINHADMASGLYPEYIKSTDADNIEPDLSAQAVTQPGARFEFLAHGTDSMDGVKPQMLEARGDQVFLNGTPIDMTKLQPIMEALEQGLASVRYPEAATPIAKTEEILENLMKIEEGLAGALSQLRAAVKAGHVHPDALKHITGHIFKDTLVPSMGNRKAYNEFMAKPRPGVHVHMDLNDFGKINKVHGFEVGDQAIKGAGEAIRAAADESGPGAKAHRVGGDEFMLHFPTAEHAQRFARTVRSKFEQIPHIGGTHKISASMGIGHTPEHAEQALIHAKTAKKAANYPEGQSETHAHSMLPGAEGPIPVGVTGLKVPHKPSVTSTAVTPKPVHPMLADLPTYKL